MTPGLELARIRQCIALACLPFFIGCNSDAPKGMGQALATVNGSDITVHQVNAEMRSAPAAGNSAQQQQRALEQVIDRELLARQAIENKLDRDPGVLMAIERSKAQILAQAYLQGRVSNAAKPDRAAIDAYTQSHPELFVNRKVYNLRTLTVASSILNDALSAVIDQAKSLDELAVVLRERKIAFSENTSQRSSAELPEQLTSNLDLVSKRPIFIMRDGDHALLASLAYVKDAPVNGDEAAQQAERYLAGRNAMNLAQEEVKRLRLSAKIAYAKGSEPLAAQPVAGAANAASAEVKAATESGISGLR